jgi:uncharacterized protein
MGAAIRNGALQQNGRSIVFRRNVLALLSSIAISSSLASAAGTSTPQNAAAPKSADGKTALAMQVMEITNFDRLIESMRSQVAASIEQSAGFANQCAAAKPEFDEFAKALSGKLTGALMSNDFKVDVAAVYAETFDESELRDLIAFYKSPLGKKLIARMPELTSKSMQISQSRIQAITPDLERIVADYEPRIAAASKGCDVSTDPNALSPPPSADH